MRQKLISLAAAPGVYLWLPPRRRSRRACAAFLKQSPWRASALGVRQNFNAIGTEHWYVPRNKIALSQSRVPAGANAREPFTQELGRAYQARILEAFVTVDQLQKIGRQKADFIFRHTTHVRAE